MMDRWEATKLYIDLTEREAVWLKRTLARYIESDAAFGIRCKLSDSMKESEMHEHETGDPYEVEKHPATAGVEAYADEGRAYYKKAAVAQISIGIGAIIQAIAVVAIAFILASCSMVPQRGDTERSAVHQRVQAVPEPAERARIDAGEVIKAADESGCDLGAVVYSEGKRESKIGVYCQGQLPVPGM